MENKKVIKPTEIKSLQDKDIVGVFCGQHHTIFLSSTGLVYACGNGFFGQLGLQPKIDYVHIISLIHHSFLLNKLPVCLIL